jgi:hypothetical protein
MTTDPSPSGSGNLDNPYAPPRAELEEISAGDPADGSSLAVRRALRRREKAIKRVAWINLLGAFIWLPAAGGSLFFLVLDTFRASGADFVPSIESPPGLPTGGWLVLLTLFHVGIFSLFVTLFIGLRRLASWARWAMVGLASLVLFLVCLSHYWWLTRSTNRLAPDVVIFVATPLAAVVLYVLISAPSGEIFTRRYREAVALRKATSI